MPRLQRTAWSLMALAFMARLASAQEVKLLPTGLADPLGRTGILCNATGGLDVVALATGELLWETKEAQRPILVLGQRLYAQAATGKNSLRLLAFDLAEQGPCVFTSDPVDLPGWINTQESPGRSFSARWQQDRNRFVLTWQAAAWNDTESARLHLTGQSGTRSKLGQFAVLSGKMDKLEAPSDRQQATGRASIDLETGKVELLPVEAEGTSAPAQPPVEATKLVLRWQGESRGNYAALSLESVREHNALFLRIWDRINGKQAPPKELLRGRRLAVLPSVDGRYLCLRDAMPSPDIRANTTTVSEPCQWSVFTPETGDLIARLPYVPGTQAVAIVGPRAYFLVAGPVHGPIDRPFDRPQVLKAVEIQSGKFLWERPVEAKHCVPAGL